MNFRIYGVLKGYNVERIYILILNIKSRRLANDMEFQQIAKLLSCHQANIFK